MSSTSHTRARHSAHRRPQGLVPRLVRGRARRPLAVTAAVAVGLISGGVVVAHATPFEPDYPTVYISQSDGSRTTLKQAAQSRLANAGQGGVTISDVATAASAYNALGYRVADGYMYGVASNGQLVRINQDGTATPQGSVTGTGWGAMYSGAFGEGAHADTFFTRPTNAGVYVFAVDVTARTASRVALTSSVNLNDFTWAHGHLWGVEADTKSVVRIDVATGTVTKHATTGVFPAEDRNVASPGYGAAWTYGNGNIAVSNNESGLITQFRVLDPTGDFTVENVSTIQGPTTSQNDAATTPSLPADLALTVVQPGPAAPGEPITWAVVVSNVAGPGTGGSSGAVVQFPVPDGVTDVVLPVGCTLSAGVVQCVTDPIPLDEEDTFTFGGRAPGPGAVSATSPVTVVGNELDPTPPTATITVTPLPTDYASTGVATTPQTVTVPVPGGGTLSLLDADGDPVATLTVPGQGGYSAHPTTGVITFTPVLGFTGPATPAPFRVVTPGGTASGTYTPTVLLPTPPTASPFTSTGPSPEAQRVTPTVPAGTTLGLRDADGASATTVTVPGQGRYAVVAGDIVFTPEPHYAGTATPVTFRITDAYGQHAQATYTPTVLAPAPPVAVDLTSTGTSPAAQTATPAVPANGSVTLLDADGDPAASVTVPAQGTYTLTDGVVTFTPLPRWTGTATPVDYRVTDAYGQSDEATYTPTVLAPAPPAAPQQGSTGVGTAPQQVTLPIPAGGSVTLLDADGDPVTSVTVPDVGTYTLVPATGVVTFTPELGYQGAPDPQPYRVVDAYGQGTDGEYAVTVQPPAPPVAADVASSGPVRTPQETTVAVPDGGTATLLDADGAPSATVTVPGAGTYTLDPVTGVVELVPEPGFAGTPPAVPYRVTDAYGQESEGTYQADVVPPSAPVVDPHATTGLGTAPHTVVIPVPEGATVTLLDADGDPATTVTTPGVGTYTLDPATGTVVFVPELGFVGTGEVEVRVTDEYGQSSDGTYTTEVTAPPAPIAPPFTSHGAPGAEQSPTAAVPVPAGGSVMLVDADGAVVTSVTVAGQGTYQVDPVTGELVFTPLPGFSGTATPVTYRVTDAYGQTADGTYAAVVAAPALPEPEAPSAPEPAPEPTAEETLPVTGFVLGSAAVVAGALLLVGTLLMAASRRRREA